MKKPKLNLSKLKKHKLKSPKRRKKKKTQAKKKKKKSQSKKKKSQLKQLKIRIPRISRVDGRLRRTKDYSALIYFVLGIVFLTIMILTALKII